MSYAMTQIVGGLLSSWLLGFAIGRATSAFDGITKGLLSKNESE